jgi:hypothetical protein
MIVETLGQDRPLCPNDISFPLNQFHYERTRLLDAFYNAAEKDDDSEFVSPEVDKAYYETAYGKDRSGTGMRLFHEAVTPMGAQFPFIRVEAWYFRCPICGFVLPANQDNR